MKIHHVLLAVALLAAASLRLHSQSKTGENSGAVLLKIKETNNAILVRQAATLETLKNIQVESKQLRIVSKRG